MKIHEKIRSIRKSKGWSQERMAEKLKLSVNGYANIERGETDVQVSRLEQIAETFGMELLELFNFGERNVFYLVSDNDNTAENNFFNCRNLQSIDFSSEKNEFEHELEKARLLLQEKEKENNYLKEIIASLMKNERKS
jgi:transcriptional regulator with XRE-family HTH domain